MVDTLYYKTYYAYLLGNLHDTKMFYELLKDEVKHKGAKDLNHNKLKTLAGIKKALDLGQAPRAWDCPDLPYGVGNLDKEPEPLEKDLRRRIHEEAIGDLKEALGAGEGFHLANIEHPCPGYGYLDLLYMDGHVAYPIEVKRGTGKHDLIGQISKYDLSIRLKLHYHFYDEVQSATICNDYHQFVLQELKKRGVMTLLYEKSAGRIKISKI